MLWLKSTNRNKDEDTGAALQFAKVIPRSDARTSAAVGDVIARHGVTSANDAIVVERVKDPVTTSRDVERLVVTGGLLCSLGWLICACFWPRVRTRSVESPNTAAPNSIASPLEHFHRVIFDHHETDRLAAIHGQRKRVAAEVVRNQGRHLIA